MIDLERNECQHCHKPIPMNRKFCYICDLVQNGRQVKTPKNIKELVADFLNNVDTSNMNTDDVVGLFGKFEQYVDKRKYRITIE